MYFVQVIPSPTKLSELGNKNYFNKHYLFEFTLKTEYLHSWSKWLVNYSSSLRPWGYFYSGRTQCMNFTYISKF